MGLINRALLFLYTLFIALLSLGVILLVMQVVPERYIWNEYQYLVSNWQTGAGALLFFLLSVHLLFCSFYGQKSEKMDKSRDVVLVAGDSGSVEITLDAVREMVQRLALGVSGVREAKVICGIRHLQETGDQLSLDVRLVVGQEKSIGGISDEIRHRVSNHMETVVGVKDYQVAVSVTSIVGGVATKKRRVV